MPAPHGPLQGVKVVACSTAQAGTVPYMLMADLGAEVIKIEVPEGGDNSRGSTVLPGLPSTYFETNNRGVKSVTLNLKSPEGREILHRLVARADMFGQNFRPGAAEKNGFGYAELRKVNPRLVYISISGYGPNGPNAHLPGTDSMAQALGGIAEAYSDAGPAVAHRHRLRRRRDLCDPRVRRRARRADLCAQHRHRPEGRLLVARRPDQADGLDADHGDVAQPGPGHRPGAHHRHRGTPRHQRQLQRPRRQAAGVPVERRASMEDGDDRARILCSAVAGGFAELGVIIGSDEKRAALLRMLDELFATGLRDDWVAKLRAADIVAAPINTLLEASNDPDVVANGYVAEVDYPKHGKRLKVHGTPWQFSETPAQLGIAPELGADNAAVLSELGYSPEQISEFRQRKVI